MGFVVCLVFFAAKLTTIHGNSESGFLACVVVVIIAQLMPQIVASLYPTQFLELIVMRPAYWACICLETSGITHICWVLAWLMGKMFGMKEEVVDDGVEMDKQRSKDNLGFATEVA